MTCNKDCKDCIYAAQIKSFKCNPSYSVTCNGQCTLCSYARVVNITYKCNCFMAVEVNYEMR